MILEIPYEYKNGEKVASCCTETLSLNISDYSLCGDKYFTLRVIDISTIDGQIGTTFTWEQDTYTTTSLQPTELIELLATAFSCPPSYGCANQECSFDWSLAPVPYELFTSTTVVDDTQATPPNRIYAITSLRINGVNYGSVPYNVWNDGVNGHACNNVNAYFDAIIAYLVSLNIPSFKGAVNLGIDGATDNYQGVGLLQLYWTSGTTVLINIASTSSLTGTFTSTGTDVNATLLLTVTDRSTLDTGDILIQTSYQCTDGNNLVGTQATPDGTMKPYSITQDGNGLNTENYWIITLCIRCESGCAKNNFSTGYITPTQIQTALSGTPVTGSSIA